MIPKWYTREIHIGDTGPDVKIVRRKLGLNPDEPYDVIAAERIRGMATKNKIETSGEVNEPVAEKLGESAAADAGLTPEWYQRDLQLWFMGDDVLALRKLLKVDRMDDDRYDPDLEAAVRRYQSANGLPVDGLVTAELATKLGEV